SAVVPGVSPPTGHIETPAALALVVFLSVHIIGVRMRGVRDYLHHYLEPSPLLLPLNILSELTRSFSLMVRLFGNMMSHEFVLGIVVVLAGLFVPVPFMLLGILIGVVQAYIFAVLATVYIGAALGAVEA
ncbi:MAG: F0F1 ATP synthase subunit A, partial [Alphaproteobacteria bacterium]